MNKLKKGILTQLNFTVIVYGLLLSLAIFISVKMPTEFTTVLWNEIRTRDILAFIVIFIFVLSAVCTVLYCGDKIESYLKNKKAQNKKDERKWSIGRYVVIYLVLIFLWFPIFLSFYPGNLSPDSYSSIVQALNHITSNAHPILYTFWIRICLRIGLFLSNGDMNAAIAVYSIWQMLFMAGIFTYFVSWLIRHGATKVFCILTTIYFAVNPLIARYVITMWKDIPFSGVVLLLILTLYDIANEGRVANKIWCKLIILSALAAFLRNRVIYLLIIAFIIILCIHKECSKKLTPVFVCLSVAILLIQGPIYNIIGIKASNFSESQGVTLQQVACTVVDDGEITEEQKAFIAQIIPLEDIENAYKPGSVDTLKGYKTFNHNFLNTHKAEFTKLWFELLPHNISSYVKAWLMNTRGYWGFNVWFEPFAITWEDEELGIYQVNFIKQWMGIDVAYISNGILVNMGKVLLVRRFFDLGALGWLVAFYCLRQIIKRHYRQLLPVLPLVMIWITLILTTPVFREVRYMFAFHLTLPFILFKLVNGEDFHKQEI